jgi:hypothetical protein
MTAPIESAAILYDAMDAVAKFSELVITELFVGPQYKDARYGIRRLAKDFNPAYWQVAAYQYSTGQTLRPQDKRLAFDFARHVAALAAPATVDRNAVLEEAATLIDRKVASYDANMGMTDPDTGTREYPGEGAEWVHEMDELAEEIRALKSAAPVSVPQPAAPKGYVLALQTVVELPDGKKELGYTLLSGVGIFQTREEVSAAIAELSLPLGWVSMTTDQLLPGWMLPDAPAVAQPAAQGAALDAARWRYSMEFQDAGGDQPQAIIEMWRKVTAEGRLKPTRAEYEAATDAAIAAARTPVEQSTDKPAEGM